MKFKIVFLAIISATIFLSSCTDNNKSTGQGAVNTLQKIINSKELHVGTIIFEPTIMKDPKNDSLKGVFIDMITKIAKAINPDTKIIYHPTSLANFSTELNSGKFDICIGATFATPKRASMVAFSHPLFYCGYTGVAKKTVADKFKSWSSIDKPNVKIAVLQGSAIADLVKTDFTSKNNVQFFPGSDITIPLAAVSSNQADVGLMNQITVFTFLREHPELVEVMGNEPLATTYFSWAVRQEDVIWLNFINTSIDYMINSGDMYKFEKKYSVPMMHPKTDFFYPGR
jgi:polar amino acid transport system substrate-binding protein